MPNHEGKKRAIASWWLYDLANTAFSMGVISLYLPLWVRDEVGAEKADVLFGTTVTISMGILFFLSPVIGAISDHRPRRMPLLIASTLLCVFSTLLLARFDLYVTLFFFLFANIGFRAGLIFYDSMLPDVSTPENIGKISGIGVALGYVGSLLAVALEPILGTENKALLFSTIAILFLVLALPCFFFVKEKGNAHPKKVNGQAILDSLRSTWQALRDTKSFPGVLRFLIGRALYADVINTTIAIMALYVINIAVSTGLSESDGQSRSVHVMTIAILAAILGGGIWGLLVDKFGPKKTLNAVLFLWMGTLIMAALLGFFDLPLWVLYVVGCGVGVALGGGWTADRPLLLKLVPSDRVGEFFGLYGMVGRFAAVVGPGIWALIMFFLVPTMGLTPRVGQGIGILFLLGMTIVSFLVLRPVRDSS